MKHLATLPLLFISMILMMSGCAVQFMEMKPEPNGDQRVIYIDGRKTIVSEQKHYVSLSPFQELNNASGKTSYVVYIENLGQNEITVGSDNVSVNYVSLNEPSTNGTIHVQSYSELMQEVDDRERQQRTAAALSAFAGALNAQSAAYSTSTTNQFGSISGNYRGNSYGTYANNPYNMNTSGTYSGSYNGLSTTSTYDPAKAQALANQNNEIFRNNLNDIARNATSLRQQLDALFMKTQTIMPGKSNGGVVVTDTRGMNSSMEGYFQVMVSVEEDMHIFNVYRTLHNSQGR